MAVKPKKPKWLKIPKGPTKKMRAKAEAHARRIAKKIRKLKMQI